MENIYISFLHKENTEIQIDVTDMNDCQGWEFTDAYEAILFGVKLANSKDTIIETGHFADDGRYFYNIF